MVSVPVFFERGLEKFLAGIPDAPDFLIESMRYSVTAGGKRLRPILVMASARVSGCPERKVLPAACAMEMIHTYSLIHDDLPAMDNDDLRRGKPTNHKVYGEGTAILAGDALLTHAFSVLCSNAGIKGIGPGRTLRAVSILSRYSGAEGMVGGQAADLQAEGTINHGKAAKSKKKQAFLLDYIHLHKTAALIRASCEIGAVLAGATAGELRHFSNYGRSIGLAFQIIDDILDVTGDKKKLGKSGSDAKNQKLTYAALFGVESARKKARYWISRAHAEISKLKIRPQSTRRPLHEIADFILARDY